MTKRSHVFWTESLGPYDNELALLFKKLSDSEGIMNAEFVIREHLNAFSKIEKREVEAQRDEELLSGQEVQAMALREQLRLRYRAYLLLLLDLLRQGWTYQCENGKIALSPPSWEERAYGNEAVQAQKAAIRKSLDYERKAQLRRPSVQDFIRSLERKRQFKRRIVTIQSLYADGKQLASDLAAVASLPDENAQRDAISKVIKPYLQLVTPDARCKYTGFLLNDIWRYIRYSWSIPYNPTPGRNMFYLVRDAARPLHPVIGIAGLGSSMVQLTERDDIIGWTPKAMFERIRSSSLTLREAEVIVQMMTSTIQAALDDLATEGLASDEELACPTDETLSKLRDIADTARVERQKILGKRQIQFLKRREVESLRKKLRASSNLLMQSNEVREIESTEAAPYLESIEQQPHHLDEILKSLDNELAELAQDAQKALFMSKRAETLHSLLRARRTLSQAGAGVASVEGLQAFIKKPEGQQVIQTLVRENKKRKVGINMMDIIICGAIPPYNSVLGGKLVAMLMASPKIIYDYKQKYTGYASNIASQMKGRDVYRDPKLVFLGTTSLYQSGSSQYNRISIPLEDGKTRLRYIDFGRTVGFGSVHLSEETIRTLAELQESVDGATLINNRFGEGVNPKFRRVRAGLARIGLSNSDEFLNNRSRRIIYGVPLGKAAYEFLRGEIDDPEYFFDVSSANQVARSTRYIAEFWAMRWLLMRVKNQRVLQEVSSFRASDLLLSREMVGEPDNTPDIASPEGTEDETEVPRNVEQYSLFESGVL